MFSAYAIKFEQVINKSVFIRTVKFRLPDHITFVCPMSEYNGKNHIKNRNSF